MSKLNLTKRSVNAAINNGIKATHNGAALTLALSYCVYYSLADANGDYGKDFFAAVHTRYKADVKAYLLAFGHFVYDNESKGMRQKKGLNIGTGEEEITAHKAKVMKRIETLPSFDDFKKELPKAATKTPSKVDISKRVASVYSAAKKALNGDDQQADAKDLKVLNALESYQENINNGVSLQDAVNASAKTEKQIAEDAIKTFIADVLAGKGRVAQKLRDDIIHQYEKVQARTPVQTNVADGVIITKATTKENRLAS